MKTIIFFTIFLFSFLVFLKPVKAEVLGISPSSIRVDNLLTSNVVNKELYLMVSNNDVALNYEVTVTGTGAKYVSFSPKIVSFSPTEKKKVIKVVIKPINAPLGDYNVKINVKSINHLQATVSIITGVSAQLNFSVTNKKIRKLDIRSSQFYTGQSAEEANKIRTVVYNNNNSDAKIDVIYIKYYDSINTKYMGSEEVSLKKYSAVAPYSKTIYEAELSYKLPLGKYLAEVQFLDGQKVVETKIVKNYNIYPYKKLDKKLGFIKKMWYNILRIFRYI